MMFFHTAGSILWWFSQQHCLGSLHLKILYEMVLSWLRMVMVRKWARAKITILHQKISLTSMERYVVLGCLHWISQWLLPEDTLQFVIRMKSVLFQDSLRPYSINSPVVRAESLRFRSSGVYYVVSWFLENSVLLIMFWQVYRSAYITWFQLAKAINTVIFI